MSVLDDLLSPDFEKKLDRVVLGVNQVEIKKWSMSHYMNWDE